MTQAKSINAGRGWSLTKGAQVYGVEPKTLRAAFERVGIAVLKGARYQPLEICHALHGLKDREQARLLKADADIRELEAKEKSEELVSLPTIQRVVSDIWLAYRQRLLALPAEACAKVNPSDPQFAHAGLTTWVDEALRSLRSEIEKAAVRK